jgi:hypothetical protein
MKRLIWIVLTVGFAGCLALSAAEAPKRRGWTEEQKKIYKELLNKYDENKDGRLDKQERSKMSAEDQKKLEDLGFGARKKKGQ